MNALQALIGGDATVMPVMGRYGHCAVCRTGFLHHEIESRWFQFILWRCDHCGTLQRFPAPERLETREQFGLYAPPRDAARDWAFIVQQSGLDRGRLLHVECGQGDLLNAARQAGWEAYGLVRSEIDARRIRRDTQLSAEAGTLETCGYEDGIFDVVVAWNVLELSENPARFLKCAAAKLKAGGRLFVQTVNADSLYRRLAGSLWPQLVPVHRYLLTPTSWRELAASAGLCTTFIATPGQRLGSRMFLAKSGALRALGRWPFMAKLGAWTAARWKLRALPPDSLQGPRLSALARWMETRSTGDQILAVSQRSAPPAVDCVLCGSTLVNTQENLRCCLRCGVQREELSAGTTQPTDGARLRFLRAQQTVWSALLARAEKKRMGGRLLDIGCNDGAFMQLARQRGWDVWGVEPGDYEGSATSPLVALRIIAERSWTERFMPASCDLITLWDTLHQSDDPETLLKVAGRLLAADGRLVARLRAPRGFVAGRALAFFRRFYGENSFCWRFEAHHVRTLFARAGFSDIQIDEGVRIDGSGEDAAYFPISWIGRSRWFRWTRHFLGSPWLFVTARHSQPPPARRVRALHLVETLGEGESSAVVLSGIEALPYNQFQCDVVAGVVRPTQSVNGLRRLGTRVKLLEALVAPGTHLRANWTAVRALVRILKEGGYDVLHSYGWRCGVIGRLAARWAWGSPKRRVGKHVIYQPMGNRFHGFYDGWRDKAAIRLERMLNRWTDALVVPTDLEICEFTSRGAGAFERAAAIPEGVPFQMGVRDRAAARREIHLPEDGWFFGAWCALEPGRGLELLLQAAQAVLATRAEARLVVAGMGSAQLDLEALAKQLGITDRVYFVENHMDAETFFSIIDCAVVPTSRDGFSRLILQAAAAGRPSVATAVGAHPAILLDGMTGLLVPPGDSSALAKALLKLSQFPEDAVRMGEAARAWVQRLEDGMPQFSEERMKFLLRNLYAEICAARPNR